MDDPQHDIEYIRKRVHELINDLHVQGVKVALHEMAIVSLKECFESIRQTAVTSMQMQSVAELLTTKLDHLTDKFDSVNQMVTWTVRIIIGAVILGVMALVMKQ